MKELPPSTTLYADPRALQSLRGTASGRSPEALREVAAQFEGLFIKMMLQAMRQTTPGDPWSQGAGSDLAYDLFDQQIATDIARSGGIGLAEVMLRQFGVEEAEEGGRDLADHRPAARIAPSPSPFSVPEGSSFVNAASPESEETGPEGVEGRLPGGVVTHPLGVSEPIAVEPVSSAGGAGPVSGSRSDRPVVETPFDSPYAFVRRLWEPARRAAERLGTQPEVVIAQAALETGWGAQVMRHPDGRSSYNLFGIKADDRWEGERVVSRTLEFEGGVMKHRLATFRAYGSVEESVEDYVRFIESHPRYRQVLESGGDVARYAAALQEAGYATDPAYRAKIVRIAGGELLREAVRELREL